MSRIALTRVAYNDSRDGNWAATVRHNSEAVLFFWPSHHPETGGLLYYSPADFNTGAYWTLPSAFFTMSHRMPLPALLDWLLIRPDAPADLRAYLVSIKHWKDSEWAGQ